MKNIIKKLKNNVTENKKAPHNARLSCFRGDYKGNQLDPSMHLLYQLKGLCQLIVACHTKFRRNVVWWTAGESNPKPRNDGSKVTAESRPTQKFYHGAKKKGMRRILLGIDIWLYHPRSLSVIPSTNEESSASVPMSSRA